MQWPAYILLAYLAVGLQIGLSPFIAWHHAAPNLVLLAAVFIAVNASRDAALIGCLALGILQDLTTGQQPGLYALSYGLVALFVVNTQQAVYREHPLTHFSLALAAGMVTACVILLHSWIHPAAASARTADGSGVLPAVRISPTVQMMGVLYTAVCAPVALGLLHRARRFFGFQSGRRRARSW